MILFKSYNCIGQCIASMYESNGNMFNTIPSVCELLKITYKASKHIENQLKDNIKYQKSLKMVGDK